MEGAKLIQVLLSSRVYQQFAKAFMQATGLPLGLRSPQSWQLPYRRQNENRFCALMSSRSATCAACLRMQQALADNAGNGPHTGTCHNGLTETVVPVRAGSSVVALLFTGQVFRRQPTAQQFAGVARFLKDAGVNLDLEQVRTAYFNTRVIAPREFHGAVGLLQLFAEHLSLLCNQLLIQAEQTEAPMISRAREFIESHHADELSLDRVSQAVHASKYYFSKQFKRATGMSLPEYVSRVRLESAKHLLLNRNSRVGEIAFRVGFASITQFNRIFKRTLGQSPTDYRRTSQRVTA